MPLPGELLSGYQPADEIEAADVARIAGLAGASGDPWSRARPVHLTASTLIVHPPTGEVLLRWLPVAEAIEVVTVANVRETLIRVGRLLGAGRPS